MGILCCGANLCQAQELAIGMFSICFEGQFMMEVHVSVGWFGEEGGFKVSGLVQVDVGVQETDLIS